MSLVARDIRKSYDTARGPVPVLEGVDLDLKRGDAVSLMGPSGSGKSTLLYILGALEPPTSGSVTLDGSNPYELGDKEQSSFRNRHIGFVFQDHCLMPQCTVLENVLIPTLVSDGRKEYRTRALELLERVGLGDRLDHLPSELSGGEKQRVAIARALIGSPSVVLCDEPTGNLDRKSAEHVATMLLDLHRAHDTMLVVVTHSLDLADRFPVRYEMTDRLLRARN
jgi:lipoprotein-releasing system ATP-binding protein